MVRHFLQLRERLLRLGELDHLDLVELVLADQPFDVLAVGAATPALLWKRLIGCAPS